MSLAVRNRPPLASADTASTDDGMPITIPVLANDSEPDGHALSLVSVTQRAGDTATVNPDGSVLYVPAPSFTDSDGFAYAISDGHHGTARGAVAVTVRNRPPLP